jgi:hypothetical protein
MLVGCQGGADRETNVVCVVVSGDIPARTPMQVARRSRPQGIALARRPPARQLTDVGSAFP